MPGARRRPSDDRQSPYTFYLSRRETCARRPSQATLDLCKVEVAQLRRADNAVNRAVYGVALSRNFVCEDLKERYGNVFRLRCRQMVRGHLGHLGVAVVSILG
jgi:hypothetical protein